MSKLSRRNMDRIIIDNVKKTYGSGDGKIVALDGVSFQVEEGEFAVILGPSGSGKSTMLNILGGMDRADSGEVSVFGKHVETLTEKQLVDYRRLDIGFVFQFYNLMPNLTAFENVALAQIEGGLSTDEMMEGVGLSERRNNFPSQLSGGEQQRVAIARAIVKNPRLLLCDEPTGALDSKTGQKILELLKRVQAQYHTTVIVVTHNAKLAEIADRVIRFADGTVIENRKNETVSKVEEIEW